ncbi:hypothetical protein [Leptospira santarosai]|uniref:Uncharacterized protein n=1 Tax=Leptospira santarosai str. ZUN179 TaxID=1049985 RepID=M6UGZ2_9LEPT|nr:hypothetical protein [Leptospira santarosai]EMO43825.1 hypothetical protein LEP1GSC187_0494 [Leptospira santarosai str. ZUN179]
MSKTKERRFEKSQFDPLTEALLIGIDPGVETGLAVWNKDTQRLTQVATYSALEAQEEVKSYNSWGVPICLIIEDARKRTWFGKNSEKKRQGAGSVKRDCKLWVEFCELNKIPYRLVHPQRGKTKHKAAEFRTLTGWTGRTSEHSRDAAMLVVGRGRF